jgi:hypothetical protein
LTYALHALTCEESCCTLAMRVTSSYDETLASWLRWQHDELLWIVRQMLMKARGRLWQPFLPLFSSGFMLGCQKIKDVQSFYFCIKFDPYSVDCFFYLSLFFKIIFFQLHPSTLNLLEIEFRVFFSFYLIIMVSWFR